MKNNLSINEILKTFFGYEKFRVGQEEIISHLLEKKENASVIMPTGGGKSLCYQIPAIKADNISIVISPLISLIKDKYLPLIKIILKRLVYTASIQKKKYWKLKKELKREGIKLYIYPPKGLCQKEFLSYLVP